jgi:hypothetical protein
MLKLLLDEHISPAVALGLRRRNLSLSVFCMAEWDGGAFLGQQDAACLEQAAAHGLTLVTYDRRTIPPILKAWAEQGHRHAGVIFVDEKTIPPSNSGGLVRSLFTLFRTAARWDWSDRVCFLHRWSTRKLSPRPPHLPPPLRPARQSQRQLLRPPAGLRVVRPDDRPVRPPRRYSRFSEDFPGRSRIGTSVGGESIIAPRIATPPEALLIGPHPTTDARDCTCLVGYKTPFRSR